MAEDRDEQEERLCLHCMIVELIDEFYEEFPTSTEGAVAIDIDEVITAMAKTIAELTSSQTGEARQGMIEQLMGEIMDFDAQFRREDAMGTAGSEARH